MQRFKWVASGIVLLLINTGTFSQQLKLGKSSYSVQKSAVLELESDNQGLLFTRINDTSLINLLNPADGMVIFYSPGKQLLLRSGGYWQPLVPSAALNSFWSVNGNTNGSSKRIGNIDNYDLSFITNNSDRLHISAAGNVGIGNAAPTQKLEVNGNFRLNGAFMPNNLTGNAGDILMSSGSSTAPIWLEPVSYLNTLSWNLGGNALSGNKMLGTLNNYDLPFVTNGTEKMRLTTAGRFALGTTSFDATNPEKFLVDAGATSSFNVISGKGSIDNYLQLNIQNRSATGNASSDVVATADNGNETTNYVDFGINSSVYNKLTDPVLGGANTGYLYSTGSDFVIGNATVNKALRFFTGGTANANERLRIDGSGNVGIGNLSPTEKLDIAGNLRLSGAFMPNNNAGTPGTVLSSNGPGNAPSWLSLGLANLSDAAITSPANGQLLQFNGSKWVNNSLSGLAFDTSNITAFSQKVRSLFSGSAPITYADGLIGITQASGTTNGYLSSADWNAFNNKAGSFTQGNLTESGSGVLTITGGTNAVIGTGTSIQVKQANASQSGFLSSFDWTSFNNKVSGISITGNALIPSATFSVTAGAATGTLGLNTQAANQVFAGPTSGVDAAPTFRALTAADLPTGTGSVTSVSATGTQGVTASVLNPTTTPAISIGLGAITPSSVAATGAVTGSNLSGTNTGDQTITLTGDVTGSGTSTFAATIGANKVTYGKMQQVTLRKLLGNPTAGTANVSEVTLGTGFSWAGSTLNFTPATSGTVTSVGLALPNIFTVTGSPVTSSGTLTGALATQSANQFFAGPAMGVATAPTFRAIAPADLPLATTTTTGAISVGTGLSVNAAGVLSTTGAAPTGPAGGDLTGTYPNPALATVNANTGVFGSATTVPQLTVNGKGLITAASALPITFPVTSVNSSTGDVSLGIANMNDATITAPAASQMLQYNGTKWVNTTPTYISSAITSLNGLTAASQIFATPGTTGTAPGWLSSGSVHTLNIPLASATSVTAGLISGTDYTNFSSKVGSISIGASPIFNNTALTVTAGAATGNLSLNTQAANRVFAGPITGSDAAPSFRALAAADLPIASTSAVGGISVGAGLSVTAAGVLSATNTNAGTVTSVSATGTQGVTASVLNPTTTPAISIGLGAITPSSVAATGAVTGSNLSGTNTGDQTITLTGDVTGSGTGSFATAIGANKVTYGQVQQVTTKKLLGNPTAGTANVSEVTLGTGFSWAGSTLNFTPATSGTVTSVGLALPNIFTVTGSPVTSAGTLTGALANQSANQFFAGPATGAATAPTFRAIAPADLPLATTTTTGAISVGTGLSVNAAGVLSTTGAAPTGPAGGDLTGTYPNPALATVNANTGVFGSATTVPQLTVNGKGLITAVSALPITFPVTSVNSLTGDVSLGIVNMNDATITAPTASQVLQYNGTKWVNTTPTYISSAITSLNGLTAPSQIFATPGTTGTAPNWSSSVSVHTLNIPLASAGSPVTAGLISNTDYTNFSSKVGSISISASPIFNNTALTVAAGAATGNLALANQTTNKVFAAPNGSTGAPSFRALVAADLPAGTGTVTSVGLTLPNIFTVTVSPVTTSGSLTATLAAQAPNRIFAGPTTGSNAAPGFRTLVPADIPIATATTIGGISAGSGLSVDAAGVLTTAVNTGNVWSQGGNNLSGTRQLGTINSFDLPFITKNTERMRIDTAGNVGIGTNAFDLYNPEKVLIDAGNTASPNLLVARGTTNNYLQLNLQNLSSGSFASTDIVASADNGTDVSNFVNFGINSSIYSNPANPILNGANNGYLYSTGNDFLIGNGTANKMLRFFAGGVANSNERMRIDGTNGFVGIGNTTPTQQLDVTGNLRFSGLLMPGGSAGTSGYLLQSNGPGTPPSWADPTPYLNSWRIGGNSVAGVTNFGTINNYDLPFITNSIERMRLTSAGNLGIGTNNPSTALHVAGTNPLTLTGVQIGAASDSLLTINAAGTVKKLPFSTIASGTSWTLTGNTGTSSTTNFIGTNDAQDLVFKTGATERLRIVNGVSTGTGTAGNIVVGDVNSGALRSNKEFIMRQDGDVYGPSTLRLRNRAGENGAIFETSGGSANLVDFIFRTGAVASPISSNIRFETRPGATLKVAGNTTEWQFGQPDATNGGPTLVIGASGTGSNSALAIGNFGIGNTSPSEKLDITGNLKFSGALMPGNNPGTLGFLLTSGGAGTAASWTNPATLFSSNAWTLTGNSGTASGTNFIGTTDLKSLVFRTNNAQGLLLDSLGNVAVGSAPLFTANPNREKFLVDAGTNTNNDFINVVSGKGNTNNYLQVNIQNRSNGTAASSDIVATNDLGNEATNYIDMGINSTGFAAGNITGGPSTAYLYATGNDFLIGNATSGKPLRFYTTASNTNTEAMRIDSAGFVGIGNLAPSQKLDVTGNLRLSGAFMPANDPGTNGFFLQSKGPNAAPVWYNASNLVTTQAWGLTGNTGLNAATNYIGTTDATALPFRTAAAERMRIDATGNVGIGITAPAAKLDVAGNIRISGGNRRLSFLTPNGDPDAVIEHRTYSGTEGNELLFYTGNDTAVATGPDRIRMVAEEFRIQGFNSPNGTLATAETETGTNTKLLINPMGDVAIGTSSYDAANPEQLLVDAGAATTSFNVISGKGTINNYLQLNIQNRSIGPAASADVVATADNGNELSGYIDMGINGSGNTSTGVLGGANTAYLYGTGTDFSIGNSGTGVLKYFTGTTERMRIDATGLVGIGTTPLYPFHTVLSTGSTATGADVASVETRNTTTTATSAPPILSLVRQIPVASYVSGSTATGPFLNFGYRVPGAGTYGTAIQLQTSSLNATSRLTFTTRTGMTNGNPATGALATGMYLDGTTLNVANLAGGATTLSVDATGNIIRTPSDARLKTNISTITNAVEKVKLLHGVNYNWIDTARFGSQREIGFIAQEIEKVVPEVVRSGGEYKSVNYQVLTALLAEAIKTQQDTIDTLRKQVDDQNERLKRLEEKIK